MAGEDDLLSTAVRHLVEQMRTSHDVKEHPSIEALVAYAEGSPHGADALQEHFCFCPDCCDLLLAFHEFNTPELTSAETLSTADLKQAWRRFQRLLSREQADPETPAQNPPLRRESPRHSRAPLWRFAA